jgi:predicted DNA-binding transcriptional regulator AlpA
MTPDPRDAIRAVLGDPAKATEVPPSHVPAVLGQLAELQAIFLARLMAGANGAMPLMSAPDSNLDIEEAARRLGVSVAYLYRNAGRLPFTVRIGRRLLFSVEGMERWNRRRQGR